MSNLDQLGDSLRLEEGVKKAVYKDSLGIYTIGVGFNIDGDHGGGLDNVEIDFILHHRLALCEAQAEQYPWFASLNEARQNVVIDMIYNMGAATFMQFHGTHHAIAVGDFDGAAVGMLKSRWADQVGKRAVRLARIMRSGQWES